MKRTRVTTREILERLLPAASREDGSRRLWQAACAAPGEAASLAATAALLDRLCDVGLARRVSRTPCPTGVELRYRDLSTLDVLTLVVPAEPAASAVAPAGPPAAARGRLTRELLSAVAASSRRIDLSGALSHLFDLLRGAFGCERVTLHVSSAVREAHLATLTELDDVLRSAGGTPVAPEHVRRRIEESGEALHVPDLRVDPSFAGSGGKTPRGSIIVAPLRAEAYVYGVLEMWRSDPGAFDSEAVDAAAFVAEFAAGLIRRRLEVEELVFIDQTTQIHNRRYFEEQLEREMGRCRRSGASMALLIADLDDFKKVNDTLGHTAGDSVLRQAARVLSENARQVDIVARYGGEEFAVILPDATRDAAKTAADRMLWTVSRHRFATGSDGTPWWSLTISVGGALYPDDAKSRAELIDRADRVALYAAKRSGKNRVVLWSDTAPSE